MDPIQLWNAIKEDLRKKTNEFSYATYIDSLTPVAVIENDNNSVTLQLTSNHENVADEIGKLTVMLTRNLSSNPQ